MENELGKTLAEILDAKCNKYIIPLYQRNFAWRTEEIQQLLQDVYEAHEEGRKYYIGSLVVLKRHNGDYEVIDGQQRLTVISMIAILFQKLTRPVLFYDSRPEVQEFFEILWRNPDHQEDAMRLPSPSLFYLKEAYAFLQKASVIDPHDGNAIISRFKDIPDIADFFLNNVVLVRNEIPEDTDVAAYFEIMNNRGEQLQKHEIVKAKMMEKIKAVGDSTYDLGAQKQFARIWDVCSQMDIPVHRLFSMLERKKYFGACFDFCFASKTFAVGENLKEPEPGSPLRLEQVLLEKVPVDGAIADKGQDDAESDIYTYGSIIDFPNFLMHVLRLYHKIHMKKESEDIPLNEASLLSAYTKHEEEIDPVEFAKLLLFCRTVFDRFIVKTTEDSRDAEDGRKWVLIKPTKYDNTWKFTYSFADEQREKLVKALSMLQVTFRSRIYKTWLYDILSWLYGECFETGDLSSISADKYLEHLHNYMLSYYEAQDFNILAVPENQELTRDNSYSEGTNTPHFLFNFIDYLYCCDKPEKFIKNFEFKYWNSVEHHFAQNKVEADSQYPYLHNLGNLCLVSKSSNSRLSDRDVKEKVQMSAKTNRGPNRQIIYAATEANGWNWGEKQIHEHYNELVDLLGRRKKLLNAMRYWPAKTPDGGDMTGSEA